MEKYLDLSRELKNAMERESNGDTNRSLFTWNGPLKPGKEIGGSSDQKKNQDH